MAKQNSIRMQKISAASPKRMCRQPKWAAAYRGADTQVATCLYFRNGNTLVLVQVSLETNWLPPSFSSKCTKHPFRQQLRAGKLGEASHWRATRSTHHPSKTQVQLSKTHGYFRRPSNNVLITYHSKNKAACSLLFLRQAAESKIVQSTGKEHPGSLQYSNLAHQECNALGFAVQWILCFKFKKAVCMSWGVVTCPTFCCLLD